MKPSKKGLFVGLTGGIASGKSTASSALKELGACILDADDLSRHALDVDGPCYRRTIGLFGGGIVNADGTIDRKAVSRIVFGDETARKALNAIIHPYVIHSMLKRAYAADNPVIVFDVPLLIECGLVKLMDKVIVVTADRDIRIARIVQRDHCTAAEAASRIASQIDSQTQLAYADYKVFNNGDEQAFRKEIARIYNELKELGR